MYEFNPVPADLDAESARHILGGQATLWTEFIPDFKQVEYMTFPRIAAISEALWSQDKVREWEGFSRRIQLFMKRYDQKGINYSKSAFKVSAKAEFNPEKKQLEVSLSSELPGIEKHYTTDGNKPNSYSPTYTEPVLLDETSTLKAVTIIDGKQAEKTLTKAFSINKATTKPIKYLISCSESYKGSGDVTLVNAIRGTTDNLDGEWQGWKGDNMEVVVDLQEATEIYNISVGSLQRSGSWIFFPQKVECYISKDGKVFQKVAETWNGVDPLSEEIQLQDFKTFFSPITTRYVKIVATNLGKCPSGHAGEGKPAWLFIDEIIIE